MATKTSLPTGMKAWQFSSAAGGVEKNMQINASASLPPTNLTKDKVLIKVLHMALNPVDYKITELPLVGRSIRRPATPGLDFAGRVVQSGSTDPFEPGTLVFGRLDGPAQHGTLAQYTIAPAKGMAALPDGIEPTQGAALGTAALTAYQAIVPHVKEHDRIFINGGSGGTGTYSIQIGKAVGCHVTTSCSTGNVEFCRSLGADEVIDYKTTDIVSALTEKASTRPFNLIIDNVGSSPHDLYEQSHQYLDQKGKFVQVGADVAFSTVLRLASRMFLPSFLGGGQRPFKICHVTNNRPDWEEIAKLIGTGKIKSVIERQYAFEEARSAYERMKSGRTRGKLVVDVPED